MEQGDVQPAAEITWQRTHDCFAECTWARSEDSRRSAFTAWLLKFVTHGYQSCVERGGTRPREQQQYCDDRAARGQRCKEWEHDALLRSLVVHARHVAQYEERQYVHDCRR